MGMHVHELHAASVHAPLVLLPAASMVDLAAAVTGKATYAELGRKLWWLGIGSGLLAGVAGAAASREIKVDDPDTEDMLWLHGIGNVCILLGAIGVALWRNRHPPSVAEGTIGLLASGLATYTAYLGGEMVYTHGVGIKAMPKFAPEGVRRSPPVLSREAPRTFVRDAISGLGWLIARSARVLRGRADLRRRAFGLSEPSHNGHHRPDPPRTSP
jgi:uncharacterized membrane protein